MKIGMIVNNLEVSGGYQKLVIRLAQQLQTLGHKVIVYTPKLDTKKCYPNDIQSIDVVGLPKIVGAQTPVEAYKQLTKQIDTDLQAIIIHDELSLLAMGMLPLRSGQRVVWMLNNQLSENLKKYGPEMRNVYRQTVGTSRTKLSETKKATERVRLLRKGLRRVNVFATYDQFNQDLVRKILGRRETVVVSAGADLDKFKAYAKKRSFSPQKHYTVLSVGVIFPHRRYEDLIEAMALLKPNHDIDLVIVGRQDLSPDYFKDLQQLTKKRNLDKAVKFKNYVSDKEMVKLYEDSSVFTFVNDGFTWGISVFEAVAAKLPVIITDNIGAADLVKNNQTGWVVPPRQPAAIAAAIKAIIDNPESTAEIANRAYRDLLKTVSWSAYTQRMLKLIKS